MMRFVAPSLGAWAVAGLLVLSSQSTAHARRGFFFITTGETVKHVGEVASNMKASASEATGEAGDLDVGYLHSRFGLFWVDVWTWGGKYVLYDDNDQVWELDQEMAAELMGVEPKQVGKPIFYTIPPGLVIVGLLGAGWAYTARRQSQQARLHAAELEEAANDPRYQRALGFLHEYHRQRIATAAAAADGDPESGAAAAGHDSTGEHAAFDRAVQMVAEQGVPRDEAERRLWMLWATKQSAPA